MSESSITLRLGVLCKRAVVVPGDGAGACARANPTRRATQEAAQRRVTACPVARRPKALIPDFSS